MPDKDRTPEGAETADAADESAEKSAKTSADDGADERDESADERDEARREPASAEGSDEEHADEAAARVAAALGVDGGEKIAADDEPDKAVEATEPKAAPNRASRRREEARKRRGASGDEMPRDKNARAKELLKRRQDAAAERQTRVSSQLEAGEIVEDVVARATSGAWKWIRANFAAIQMTLVAALLVTGGVLFYFSRTEKKGGEVSGALAAAVAADRGRVLEEDKRGEDEKELDPTKIFKTPEARADAALAAYKEVADQYGGTGAAILARLGQAGAHLDKKEWGPALEAYSAVAASPLGGADPDVKGRAIEGMGFAKEGKGDLDGALAHFKELESIDARGYKELALYHQARIHKAKGDKEKAKELLKAAREKLASVNSADKTSPYLERMVDVTLGELDPTAVPAAPPQLGGPKGGALSPEELERLIQKAKENAQKRLGGEHEEK